MVYPTDEETFDTRTSPEWIRQGHLNAIQAFLKRIQDFLGYGGRLHDKSGLVIPVGAIMPYTGLTAPAGWLLCDGKSYNRTASDYADLFAVIGTKYGALSSAVFNVPDLRGCFLRGYSKVPTVSFVPEDVNVDQNLISVDGEEFNRAAFPVRLTTDGTLPAPLVINTTYYIIHSSAGVVGLASTRAAAIALSLIDITTTGAGTSYINPYLEEDKDARLKLTFGGNDGEDLGSYQPDAFQGHYHSGGITTWGNNTAFGLGFTALGNNAGAVFGNDFAVLGPSSDGSHGTPRLSVESRPRNVNVNYIIKR